MKLNEKIIAFIRENCSGIYKENRLQLEELLRKLSLKCLSAEYPRDISGAIIKDDDDKGYTIYVNKEHPKSRQRFTIAHEIGHYISYLNGSFSKEDFEKYKGFEDKFMYYLKDGNSSNAEIEANLIAVELLMPEERVKTLIKDNLTIEEMADIFFVSQVAMTIRVQKMFPDLFLSVYGQ